MKLLLKLGCWGRQKDSFMMCSAIENTILDLSKNTELNVEVAEFLDKAYNLTTKPLYNNVHTALWRVQDDFGTIGKPLFKPDFYKQIEEFCVAHAKCGLYLKLELE